MDPLTAALILANTVAEIVKLAMEGQPPEVRAEFARMHLEDMHKWRAFVERFSPKQKEKTNAETKAIKTRRRARRRR